MCVIYREREEYIYRGRSEVFKEVLRKEGRRRGAHGPRWSSELLHTCMHPRMAGAVVRGRERTSTFHVGGRWAEVLHDGERRGEGKLGTTLNELLAVVREMDLPRVEDRLEIQL